MSDYFENIVKVNFSTQRIEVDHAGNVTLVEAGPVGPRGFSGDGSGGATDHGVLTCLLPEPDALPDGTVAKVSSGVWVAGSINEEPTFLPSPAAGTVYSQPGPFSTFSSYVSTLAEAAFTALFLPAGTYDQIFINCTVAGDVTLRFCIDSVGNDGLPETLLHDAGTVGTAGAAGFKIAATEWVNEVDRWVWMRVQTEAVVSATTVTVLNSQSGNQWPPWLTLPSSANASRAISGGRVLGHAIGPNTEPFEGSNGVFILNSPGSPRVWARRSA